MERHTWRDTSSRDRHLGRHIAKARLSSIGASYFRMGHSSQCNRATGNIGRRNLGALATLADVIASPATLADVIATPGTLADVIRRWVHVPILSVLGTSCTDFAGFRYMHVPILPVLGTCTDFAGFRYMYRFPGF